jgi:hypothetical protein
MGDGTMSTIKVDNLQTTGGVGLFPSRAWVNFNGTGTVAIRADGNVSSITDNGTGNYVVSFSSSFIDVNYASTSGINGNNSTFNTDTNLNFRSETTSSINTISGNEANNGVNPYGAYYVATR